VQLDFLAPLAQLDRLVSLVRQVQLVLLDHLDLMGNQGSKVLLDHRDFKDQWDHSVPLVLQECKAFRDQVDSKVFSEQLELQEQLEQPE